ncbi:hypothetical protein BDZ91DRAFT_233935 [Kalaharituber pfeilii]|nr:hypothetical protein BDZ91DRAFT_233935 [Kalaharituber pfeilii]
MAFWVCVRIHGPGALLGAGPGRGGWHGAMHGGGAVRHTERRKMEGAAASRRPANRGGCMASDYLLCSRRYLRTAGPAYLRVLSPPPPLAADQSPHAPLSHPHLHSLAPVPFSPTPSCSLLRPPAIDGLIRQKQANHLPPGGWSSCSRQWASPRCPPGPRYNRRSNPARHTI